MMGRAELRKALKPITDGLFGKQQTKGYERPHFEVCPLAAMLQHLVLIEPVEWYRYAFSREPLNGKFHEEQRREWMEKSLQCGRHYASLLSQQYGSCDPQILAVKMGLEISFPEFPEKTDRVLFAEYRLPNKVCIYMDAVNKAAEFMNDPQVAEILTSNLDISRLLLAHELFHHVEEKYQTEIFSQTETVRLWSIGFVHNDSKVIALSEIAAMGFAQELLGLPYSPYVMDAFLVYGYSAEEASGLYEEMMDYAGRSHRE